MKNLVKRWVEVLRTQPILFGFLLCAFIAGGTYLALQSEIEAFPEFTNVQVQVITQYPGKAAEEIERQVTVPLEVATAGLPGLINARSISIFGLSLITLTFDDQVNSRQARLDTSQRFSDVDLPEGVKPSLSPDSTPVGEIYRYTLKGALPTDELRLIEDWTLEREFKSIPGVADVVSFGGPMRTVEIKLDLNRMKALGLSVSSVAAALGQNHANAGGSMVTHGEEAFIVRSLGLYEKPENLEAAVISTSKGIPVRVRDIGTVQLGHKPRLGIVGVNESDDAVEGIILLRQGADSMATCRLIRERILKLNSTVLPSNVKVVPYYDRTNLIRMSSETVLHNIVFGILLVILLLWFGLGARYWFMTLAVAIIIPFSLLTVFVTLRLLGYTPNLISLGAVDFGIIIESAIFSAEALVVSLGKLNRRDNEHTTLAFAEVLGPALLCALLLMIAFIPILSLQRVEGRIFRPLGITLIAALLGGQIGTFIFIPIAALICPIGTAPKNRIDTAFEFILNLCERVAKRIASFPRVRVVIGLSLGLTIILLAATLGREFLPNLNEGSLYIRATAPSTISIEAASSLAAVIRARLKEIPEVVDVVSQTGRPDDGTDVNGFDNIELFVALLPPNKWNAGRTLNGLIDDAKDKLKDMDGVDFNFSQPIKDNVDEAISGVKGELVVKVFGPQLPELQKLGDKLSELLKSINGAEDVGAEKLLGQPELRFTMNRDLLARYGLRVTDAEDVLETALLGKFAAKLTDEQGRSVDIVVKPDLPLHPNIELLSSLPIVTADGAKIPLGEVSTPKLVEGVGRVYRESGERRIAVKCSVRNRAVVSFVEEASRKIKETLSLPPKYRIQWSGSFENAERASKQLMLVVPLCMITMIILLYTWFGSWRAVGFLLWEIPFAAIGGLLSLKLFGLNFSISAAAGGIVLLGVTFLTGIMLISEFMHCKDVGSAMREKGRSIILSSAVAIIGLVPAAFSHGIGSETAKPFAVMILGGLSSSLIFSLTLLPALLYISQNKHDPNGSGSGR